MAFISKTAFEVNVSDSWARATQNVAGDFNTESGGDLTAADCSAGTLCVPYSLMDCEGYESFGIKNGNTHHFIAAADGTKGGRYGDHTGIYAFNCYNVNQVKDGDNVYPVGAKILGLGLPAGERGDFTEILVGELYKFGSGNMTATPASGDIYFEIANGLLTPGSTAPSAGDGVYFTFVKEENFTEGASHWGTGYILRACRAAEA